MVGPLALLAGAANAYLIIDAAIKLTNYFRNRGKNDTFTTPDNTDKLNKDNIDKQKNFANVNRDFRGGAANNIRSTRGGVLSFLGDRSRRLDDAPDIVDDNQSVLSGVSTLGGFFPPLNTREPNIDNQRIVESGFLGVRLEIDKINRNIDAIARAMAESALFEQKYRKDMIDAMRRDLVEKGKDRSETRSERSIFNLITRPLEQIQKRVGKFKNDFAKAMLLSAGLEAANIFFPDFGGDDDDDDDGKDETKTPKVGDYYFQKNSRGGDYFVLQSNGVFKKVGRSRPKTGTQFPKSAFDPVIESIKNNQNTNLDGGGEDDKGTDFRREDNNIGNFDLDMASENKNNLNETFNSETNLTFDNKIFNSGTPVAMNVGGLEGGEKVTFIDMRRKINDSAQGGNVNGADSELVDNLPEFDPARSSIYEAFVSA